MSVMASELHDVWDALRSSYRLWEEALTEVRIRNLRGIRDIEFSFGYPVQVLAGPNGCGKSTALFACACAYRVPGRGPRDFTPAALFPNFSSRQPAVSTDAPQPTAIEFHYLHRRTRFSMTWKRGRSWKRGFPSRNGRSQPERQVYLRTLANFTNRSEVRGVLQLGRRPVETRTLDPDLLVFAHRILPWRYRELTLISGAASDLLFADVENGPDRRYSEFHMSSGERSILRISKDISRLENALILIDEIEAGLHPYTQQQAMLELQRSALRQHLQVVVASHSPVVLDSVPPDARIFLDRDDAAGDVRLAPPYRDIFQRALYGQSRDQLSVLCEDAVAEGFIRGVFDMLNVETGLRHEDVVIGRDTGRDEFPGHLRKLGKFGRLSDFLIVLDGDSRGLEGTLRGISQEYGSGMQPLFLPGDGPPERWMWDTLSDRTGDYAAALGQSAADLHRSMRALEQLLGGAVRRRDGAKAGFRALAHDVGRTAPDLARIVGQTAAKKAIPEFVAELKAQIARWRRL